MLSRSERYAFVGEARVTTLRGYFAPPPLSSILDDLSKKLNKDELPEIAFGSKIVKLTQIREIDGKVAILLRMANPDIPDNMLEHSESRVLREAKRLENEVPALSLHVLFDPNPLYDLRLAYPVMIENVESFPRSTVQLYLIRVMGDLLGEDRFIERIGEVRRYSPRIAFVGHPSKTVANVLNRGGALAGVHFEKVSARDDGFGEDAYSVIRTEEVHLRVSGKPRGENAIQWLVRKTDEFANAPDIRVRIAIEDESGRVKTARIDRTQSITENFFVLQEQFDKFEKPLLPCEEVIREDFVRKMIAKMPK